MERQITYFESIDPANTDVTFRLAREGARDLGVKKMVIASTTGTTARKALEHFRDDDVQLIIVPHQWGFRRREVNPFPPELVKEVQDAGHVVHFGTMLFHTGELYGSSTPQVMADLLRTFCQGMKVCFEIVLMAADAGHVRSGEKVIVIAGTGRGADTALVMQAATSQHLKGLRVNEILCKPLNPLNIDELMERTSKEQAR